MRAATEVLDLLGKAAGSHVIVDPEVVASYTTDWTGRFVGQSPAVVRPGSTEEVAAIVETCRDLGVALVPQGGNTGLVGGGVPLGGEVVLSLRGLQRLDPVEPLAGQLTAGAGVTIGQVRRAAASAGWSYGVDLGSRDSATVGGTVATNAGGMHMIRYGDTRAQVVGVEAVFGTGAVVSHLGGLIKDNTGYHLPSLLCGSEGTLAVITSARLRLVPTLPYRTVALAAFASVAGAVSAAGLYRQSLTTLEACEMFLEPGLELVCSITGLRSPFAAAHAAYLLVEVADRTDPTEALSAVTADVVGVAEVLVATEPSRRAELWRLARRPHGGHQLARSAPQAGRHASGRRDGGIHRSRAVGGGSNGAGCADLVVRSSR